MESIREMSIAVEFRDANRVFEKALSKGAFASFNLCPMIADSRG